MSTRFYLSYTGVKLPLQLITALDPTAVEHRNTYFRGTYDAADRLTLCEKLVYGEVEMSHRYQYHANGQLSTAEITDADGEVRELHFDENGAPVSD